MVDDLGVELEEIEIEELACSDSGVCTYIVPPGTRERLDRFLAQAVEHVSREKLKRVILDGQVQVEGCACTEPKRKLYGGEHISLNLPSEQSELKSEQVELEYIYKDRNVVVVNKPAGLTVHPCPSCKETTLVQGLLWDFPEMRSMGGQRPGIVHRLDKETSGVMIVALNESTRIRLSEAFAERVVKKTYLAIVYGVPPVHGECTEPIGRHPTLKVKMAVVRNGRPAHTEWDRLWSDGEGKYSLLAVRIHTGRTHQIRVHMAHCGYPLIGDTTYCRKHNLNEVSTQRQMLHAWKLELPKVLFHADDTVSCETSSLTIPYIVKPPADITNTILHLFTVPQRIVLTGCPGSGKSTVLKAFTELGVKTISADALVHDLYNKGQPAWRVLKNKFGNSILNQQTDDIDRKQLFQIMLNDDSARNTVNRLVHPYVNERLDQFWKEASPNGILIAEVPLWFEDDETPTYPWPINTICVHTEKHQRHKRLETLRGWDLTMRSTMDAWQIEDCDKCRLSDYVIHNNDSTVELNHEVERVLSQLRTAYTSTNKDILALLQKSDICSFASIEQ